MLSLTQENRSGLEIGVYTTEQVEAGFNTIYQSVSDARAASPRNKCRVWCGNRR